MIKPSTPLVAMVEKSSEGQYNPPDDHHPRDREIEFPVTLRRHAKDTAALNERSRSDSFPSIPAEARVEGAVRRNPNQYIDQPPLKSTPVDDQLGVMQCLSHHDQRLSKSKLLWLIFLRKISGRCWCGCKGGSRTLSRSKRNPKPFGCFVSCRRS